MARLKGEEIPNAVLGAILGVGIAASNDLSERPDNLVAAFLEITIFVGLVLGLTMLVRQGAIWISQKHTARGVAAILGPSVSLVLFTMRRAEFVTYGDVIVLSVIGIWWLLYLFIGISEARSQ